MDLRRLRAGEVIVGLSGLLLVVALLLPWYTHDVATSFGPRPSLPSQNAFESMAVADLLLLIVAVAAVGLAIDTALEQTVAVPLDVREPAVARLARRADPGSDPPRLLAGARAAACPPRPASRPPPRRAPDLALIATLVIFAGTLLAMRDERLSKAGRPTDQTGRPVDHVPEIEQPPAPR